MSAYTTDEQDRIAKALYERRWVNFFGVVPYDELPSDRKWYWRGAAVAAVRVAAEIDAERRERWRAERRTTVRVNA